MTGSHRMFTNGITRKGATMQVISSMIIAGLILVFASSSASAEGGRPAEKRSAYDPAIIYPGPYVPEQLFYRNPKGVVWLRWTKADFSKKVTCPGALKRLKRKGVWKGHLKPDGSCGSPAEPSNWAVGNWINYYLSSSPENRQ